MANEFVVENAEYEKYKKIKDLLVREAKEYLKGNSMKKVGAIVGKSDASVHYDLTKRLHDYDITLYDEVCDKIEEKKGSLDSPVVYERVLKVYNMLVNEDMIVEEISKVLKEPYFVIYRDLTKRLYKLHDLSPEKVTDEMLNDVQIILEKHSLDNLTTKKI